MKVQHSYAADDPTPGILAWVADFGSFEIVRFVTFINSAFLRGYQKWKWQNIIHVLKIYNNNIESIRSN